MKKVLRLVLMISIISLTLFISEEDFEINAETKLVLTVTNEAGTEYIDTTIIVILNRE